jgi:hypothetical protein
VFVASVLTQEPERKPEPIPEVEEVFEFSLTVRYTARMKAPDAATARRRLYGMFKWLHDGIGKWLTPKPCCPWLKDHWIEFPDSEDFPPETPSKV